MVNRSIGSVALGACLVIGLGYGVAACSSDDGGEAGVDVTLSEFIMRPKPKTVDSGDVRFTGDNVGGETHELVVVEADDAAALPTDADGSVIEEDLPGAGVIDEIEGIKSQTAKRKTMKLAPGRYVIFCNITDRQPDGTVTSHFAEGMHAELTVK